MNRAILAGSIIVGIAVMLSMSTLGTAYAERPDAFCTPTTAADTSPGHRCNTQPELTDHIHLVIAEFGFCGGEVTGLEQFRDDIIRITIDVLHAAGPCADRVEGDPVQITIPGTL